MLRVAAGLQRPFSPSPSRASAAAHAIHAQGIARVPQPISRDRARAERKQRCRDHRRRSAAWRLHCGLLRVPVSRPRGRGASHAATLNLSWWLSARSSPARASATPVPSPDCRSAEFRDENLILFADPAPPACTPTSSSLCERHGFRPNVAAEVDRMITKLNLVAAGAGVSVVPASMKQGHSRAAVYSNRSPRASASMRRLPSRTATDEVGRLRPLLRAGDHPRRRNHGAFSLVFRDEEPARV